MALIILAGLFARYVLSDTPAKLVGLIQAMNAAQKIILIAIAVPLCVGAFLPKDPLVLDASAGEITTLDLPALQPAGAVEGAFRFTDLRTDGRWAPSAFVGFRDEGQRGKFRVFLFQETRDGPLVAGYDYVLDDRIVVRETLPNLIPQSAALEVKLAWNARGEFRIAFFDEPSELIETELGSLVGFVAVSSGKARFSFDSLRGNTESVELIAPRGAQHRLLFADAPGARAIR